MILFLQERGIYDYESLKQITDSAADRMTELGASIKEKEKRLGEIRALKTHIINYAKTREVYMEYRKSGYSKKFFEAHREELTLHKAAKEAFTQSGLEKLPTVKQLNQEFYEILQAKKEEYAEVNVAGATHRRCESPQADSLFDSADFNLCVATFVKKYPGLGGKPNKQNASVGQRCTACN